MLKNVKIKNIDIKNFNLIKSRNLEGLKVVGNPNSYASKYYSQGADELIYTDVVASLYDRDSILKVINYSLITTYNL